MVRSSSADGRASDDVVRVFFKKMVFWQNTLSIHQEPLLTALVALGVDVTLVAEEELRAERRKSGWRVPDFVGCRVVVSPSRGERLQIVEKTASDSFHIVTGIHAYPETFWTLKKLLRTSENVGIYLEKVNDSGLKGFVKRMLYRSHALRFQKRLKVVLASGRGFTFWLANRGFAGNLIYPFGYFTREPNRNESLGKAVISLPVSVNFVFLGALIPRKGVHLILEALRNVTLSNWKLHIVGDGPEKADLSSAANDLGIGNKVEFVGSMPNDEISNYLNFADLLILPSRFDGWGAVVNEALQCGTPVLVSDACGSCDLIRNNDLGRIFHAGSVGDLRNKLETIISEGKVSLERRTRIRNWSRSTISPEAGASYLLEILEYTFGELEKRPVAHWLREIKID